LQDCLVTALCLQDDYLWVGTDDGSVEAYAMDDDVASTSSSSSRLPLTLRTQPDLSWKVGGSMSSRVVVTSLDICTKLGCAVVATDAGTVELLSLEDESDEQAMIRKPIGTFTPQFDGTERRSFNVYPTSVTFVPSYQPEQSQPPGTSAGTSSSDPNTAATPEVSNLSSVSSYSIACGANDGSIFIHPLALDEHGDVDTERPFFSGQRVRQLMPQHFAAVPCLASPAPGLLLTGGLDGTVRLWDTDTKKFLYQFVGYKVWLGSLWTNGERIITDGADNTIIVHDFSSNDGGATMDDKDRHDSSSRNMPDQAEDTDA
jgi:WD40 repeat protein